MEKLKYILDQHNVEYIENGEMLDCYVYSGNNAYDTLEVIGGVIYINGQPGNLLDWLGY